MDDMHSHAGVCADAQEQLDRGVFRDVRTRAEECLVTCGIAGIGDEVLAQLGVDEQRSAGRSELARRFTQLALVDDTVHVAWTDVVGGEPRLQGVVLRDPEGIE